MSEAKLKIHTWPEKILRKRCRNVQIIDDRIRDYLREMVALMRVSDGIGLAANQAGLDLRMIVVEVREKVLQLVNPEIVRRQGSMVFREGCLSFPGLELDIRRSNSVSVKALDQDGNPIEITAEEVLAVVLQHEIDHIEGKPFIERASLWQRLKAMPKLRAIAKKTKNQLKRQR